MPGGRAPLAARPGKYAPLGDYLAALPSELDHCELDLHEIEQLVGMPLPPSARTNWFWRRDEPASHARAWLDQGWRGELLSRERVRFTRDIG